jgi:hypothetical protein
MERVSASTSTAVVLKPEISSASSSDSSDPRSKCRPTATEKAPSSFTTGAFVYPGALRPSMVTVSTIDGYCVAGEMVPATSNSIASMSELAFDSMIAARSVQTPLAGAVEQTSSPGLKSGASPRSSTV